ncbi:hypothetical protein GS896_27485 [Rhodococcus hoagii]|nr:hypothetical protein [Prescottella equi]MBM4570259.1 hypothetical protein [Prescottella equi]MBM4574803.1 hypothetical protein [Prescottella equi]MBM4575108.1 hypothetical protein [Prescottella equi]MBM4575114.1 hypothetical protein [Prescottella equi]
MEFWENSNAALDKCAAASNVSEVIDALNDHFDKSAGDAFFGGSGGDRQLIDVLAGSPQGWTVFDVKADYHFKARDRNGGELEYVEGDVYRL